MIIGIDMFLKGSSSNFLVYPEFKSMVVLFEEDLVNAFISLMYFQIK